MVTHGHGVAGSEEHVERVRRLCLLLMVLIAPFLLVGAALTVSVLGAIFGLPILAASWPVLRSARRARKSPTDPASLHRLTIAAAGLSLVLTVGLVAAVILGRDDLDSLGDMGALAVALMWVAVAWRVALGARRASWSPSAS